MTVKGRSTEIMFVLCNRLQRSEIQIDRASANEKGCFQSSPPSGTNVVGGSNYSNETDLIR